MSEVLGRQALGSFPLMPAPLGKGGSFVILDEVTFMKWLSKMTLLHSLVLGRRFVAISDIGVLGFQTAAY